MYENLDLMHKSKFAITVRR